MTKITLTDLVNLQNETTAVNAINTNGTILELAIDNTISRDGTAPNQMNSNFDMNSNQILNLPQPLTAASPVRLQDLDELVVGGTISTIPVGGTTNQLLAKHSNTDYDVIWKDFTSTTTLFIEPQVRVTLTTAVPITTSDVAGATTIYATPVNGNLVFIYDGVSTFTQYALTSDLSLALDSNAAHTGYHQSGKNFYLGVYNDGGTIRLGSTPAWATDTDPGTGAGTAQIELYKGLWVNSASTTIRFGSAAGNTSTVPAKQFTVVGAFRATADGQATDSVLKRLLFNFYNQAFRPGLVQEAGVNWNYSVAAYRQVNGSTANQIEVLFGTSGTLVDAAAFNVVSNSTATPRTVASGIGVDSTTVNSGRSTLLQAVSSPIGTVQSFYKGYPGIGWHTITWLEYGNASDVVTWYGNNAGASLHRAGLQLGVFI